MKFKTISPILAFLAVCLTGHAQGLSQTGVRNSPTTLRSQGTAEVQHSGGVNSAAYSNLSGRSAANVSQPVQQVGYVPQHLRGRGEPLVGRDYGVRAAGYSRQEVEDYVEPLPMTSSVASGDCADCGVGVNYFGLGRNACDGGCDLGCRPGGCPPGLLEDCWLGRLGMLFRQGEYFVGAQGFSSPSFNVPGANFREDDSSFGFYGGANVGIPLCRITCGLLSGQIGIRSVQSNFDGTLFDSEDRDQTFVTTGLYRRVDYGLQFGVVADFLRENWFTKVDVVQIRADLAWVYPTGHALGYRLAKGVQDDQTNGIINGVAFTDLITTVYDTHRFYYRHSSDWGGFTDVYAGFSDKKHFLMGMDVDISLTECVALQSGFNYMIPDEETREANRIGQNEAWNIYVGFVFRPQGRDWYRSYDRPILPVADNGTMILRRGF